MHGNRKYPWEVWFDRPHTVLVRGVDYHCSQSTMCQAIRNEARRKWRVRLTDNGDSIVMEVLGAIQHTDKTPVAG